MTKNVLIFHRRRKVKNIGGGGVGGEEQSLEYWERGGANSQQAYDVILTSVRRNGVASTSFRRHLPTRFLINQCQIITFLIVKSDNIENWKIELKGIVLPVSSNQIKVTFIIILPFNLVQLWFFSVSHRNWRKVWVDYCGGQRLCLPPSQIIGGRGAGSPGPPSSYAYVFLQWKL